MVKLGYSYKGRPIAPYGRSSRRSSRFSRGGLLLILLAILIAAGGIYLGWELVSYIGHFFDKTADKAEDIMAETKNLVEITRAADRRAEPGVSPSVARERVRSDKLNDAISAWKRRDYRQAQLLSGELLQQISPDSPLFLRAKVILSRSSDLFLTGAAAAEHAETYKVKRGDSISRIARNEKVTQESIRRANRMPDDRLHIGQNLILYKGDWKVQAHPALHKLYLFDGNQLLKVYPMGLGAHYKDQKGIYKLMTRMQYPAWNNDGKMYKPNDPENILGSRWLELQREGNGAVFGIHGTNDSEKVGRTHAGPGYFILDNQDINELSDWIPAGTRVEVL